MRVIEPNDIIQLSPTHAWGAMICVVSQVHSWGITAYWLVAETRGQPPSAAYIRVPTGEFEVVGRAVWVSGSED